MRSGPLPDHSLSKGLTLIFVASVHADSMITLGTMEYDAEDGKLIGQYVSKMPTANITKQEKKSKGKSPGIPDSF